MFGLDDDNADVFRRTVDWGVQNAITTATYHILTPYPGTRHVVYKTKGLSATELEEGYLWAYKEFYKWNNIFKASFSHDEFKHKIKHLFYTGGWKKFESVWNMIINTGGLQRMLPMLELLLSEVEKDESKAGK